MELREQAFVGRTARLAGMSIIARRRRARMRRQRLHDTKRECGAADAASRQAQGGGAELVQRVMELGAALR
jgi:hypothetical protein